VRKKIGVRVCALNFGTSRKNVGVKVRTLNLALCSVHTHNKVCVVYTHIRMVHGVSAVLAERRGVWFVHAQCGDMLSRDSLVIGARSVLVHGGGVLNFGMVQNVE
jgi:hypothetical protein